MKVKVERSLLVSGVEYESYLTVISDDVDGMKKDDTFVLIIPARLFETVELIKSRYEDAYLDVEKVVQFENIFKVYLKNPDKIWDRYNKRFSHWMKNEVHVDYKYHEFKLHFKYMILEQGI